ncbi:MAG: peptidoglycan-associated lipoprotein [Zetaproteobacteria bacterium CG2_30_46_52]|nr:MAG: peptidoglycan-associated lipoprotein [Zetaproteobacteria bacterium CG2_30_46_52]
MSKHYTKIAMIALAIASLTFASCGAKKDSDMSGNINKGNMDSQAAMDQAAMDKAAADRAAAEKAAADKAANMAAMPSTNSAYFAFDSAVIDDAGKMALTAYATWLNNNTDVNVTVEGNCDERGSREYNLALGEERAKSVRDVLVSNGVAASRIDTVSFGEERPVCTRSGEACWAQNRRGDVVNR